MNNLENNSFYETLFIQEDESVGSSSLHLEICIEPDFVHFTGFDFIKNRFNCYERIDFENPLNGANAQSSTILHNALKSSKLLGANPHFARATVFTHQSSFFPANYVSSNELHSALANLHELPDDAIVEKRQLKNIEIDEVFALDAFHTSALSKFPVIRQVISAKGLFLELSYLLQRRMSTDILFVDFTYKRMTLSLFSNNKLLLINSFDVQTPLDVTYYSLFAAENSPVNLDTLETLVTGPEDWRKEIMGYLETYLPQSKPFVPAAFFETHATLAPLYENNFYFFNQLLCG